MIPYLSIICPCYNGDAFVDSAITSVILQPVDCLELIIIDDGSTDDTPIVCKEFISDKVRYYRTDNLGAGHARNYGLDHAEGTWIMYLDADDLYLLDSINEEFINNLYEYEKQKVDIVYTPCSYADFNLNKWIKSNAAEGEINVIPKYTFCSGIYNHAYLKNKGIKFYEYKEQDIESAFRYLAFSNAEKTITDQKMKFHLQRENYLSNTHTWDLRKVSEIKALVYNDLLKNHSHSTESRDRLFRDLVNIITAYFIEVRKAGFNNKQKHKDICKIAKECLITTDAIRLFGVKQYSKELARYIWCKYFVRESKTDNKEHRFEEPGKVATEIIIKRLQLLSKFLLDA